MIEAWRLYLTLSPDPDAIPETDAMRYTRKRNPDRIVASKIDTIAYFEIAACESLDDEIENSERFASSMPFGGQYEPIRGFQSHDD